MQFHDWRSSVEAAVTRAEKAEQQAEFLAKQLADMKQVQVEHLAIRNAAILRTDTYSPESRPSTSTKMSAQVQFILKSAAMADTLNIDSAMGAREGKSESLMVFFFIYRSLSRCGRYKWESKAAVKGGRRRHDGLG